MNARSLIIPVLMLVACYAFAISALWITHYRQTPVPTGYTFAVSLVAVSFLLAAHGFALLRWREYKRQNRVDGRIRDLTTEVGYSLWEIFFCWLGISTALLFLYYASPVNDLNQWYARLLLVVVVFFAATLHRALVFVYGVAPFVFTLCLMGLWTYDLPKAGGLPWSADAAVTVGFLAVDLLLLGWAAALTRQYGIFRFSELELPKGPGQVGGHLTGLVRTGHSTVPESGYQLELSCIRQHREGNKRRAGEILWHAQETVRGEPPGLRYEDSTVPVSLPLPEDLPPSSEEQDGSRVGWTLRVRADLPEAHYTAAFEAPVERSDRDPRETIDEEIELASGAHPPLTRSFSLATAAGLGVFHFRPRGNASSELILAAYGVCWLQLAWLISGHAMGGEIWLIAAAGLVFGGWLAAPWVVSTDVAIGRGEVEILHRFLGAARKSFRCKAGDVAGLAPVRDRPRTGLIESPDYYRLLMKLRSGESCVAGRHIRGRRTAGHVAEEMLAFIEKERSEAKAPGNQSAPERAQSAGEQEATPAGR